MSITFTKYQTTDLNTSTIKLETPYEFGDYIRKLGKLFYFLGEFIRYF